MDQCDQMHFIPLTPLQKKWYLDVRNTPCARSALLHGVYGGLVVGLLYFARTSIVRRSCDFAVGGFAVVSLVSWEVCRLRKAKERAEIKRAVRILNAVGNQRRIEAQGGEGGGEGEGGGGGGEGGGGEGGGGGDRGLDTNRTSRDV